MGIWAFAFLKRLHGWQDDKMHGSHSKNCQRRFLLWLSLCACKLAICKHGNLLLQIEKMPLVVFLQGISATTSHPTPPVCACPVHMWNVCVKKRVTEQRKKERKKKGWRELEIEERYRDKRRGALWECVFLKIKIEFFYFYWRKREISKNIKWFMIQQWIHTGIF